MWFLWWCDLFLNAKKVGTRIFWGEKYVLAHGTAVMSISNGTTISWGMDVDPLLDGKSSIIENKYSTKSLFSRLPLRLFPVVFIYFSCILVKWWRNTEKCIFPHCWRKPEGCAVLKSCKYWNWNYAAHSDCSWFVRSCGAALFSHDVSQQGVSWIRNTQPTTFGNELQHFNLSVHNRKNNDKCISYPR